MTTTDVPFYEPEVESPQQFCMRMELVLNKCCPDLKEAKYMLMSKLRGPPLERANSLSLSDRYGEDLPMNLFMGRLCEVLISLPQQEHAINHLKGIRQEAYPRIEDYATEINHICEYAYPNKFMHRRDAVMVDAFVNGLNEQTQIAVRMVSPKNVQAAVDAVHKLGKILRNEPIEEEQETVDVNFLQYAPAVSVVQGAAAAVNGFVRKYSIRRVQTQNASQEAPAEDQEGTNQNQKKKGSGRKSKKCCGCFPRK